MRVANTSNATSRRGQAARSNKRALNQHGHEAFTSTDGSH